MTIYLCATWFCHVSTSYWDVLHTRTALRLYNHSPMPFPPSNIPPPPKPGLRFQYFFSSSAIPLKGEMLEYTWQPIWALAQGWPTPAVLFVLLNLVIGTIALSSRGNRSRQDLRDDRRAEDHRPISRTSSSSVLERLRSVSLYRLGSGEYPLDAADPIPEKVSATPDPGGAADGVAEEQRPMPRTSSSIFEQIRSGSLYRFRSGEYLSAAADGDDTTPEPAVDGEAEEHRPMPRTSSSIFERLRSVSLHRFRSGECLSDASAAGDDDTTTEPAGNGEAEEHRPMSRTSSSVLERLRSIGLYRFRSGDDHVPEPDSVAGGVENEEQHYGRSKSESRPPPQAAEGRMKKTASASVVSAGFEESVEEEEEVAVDARADDFINRFRQQLKLQRINSILNYREMLSGGK